MQQNDSRRKKMISSDDQPWFTEILKKLTNKKKLEYHTNRRAVKWKKVEHDLQEN